MRVAGLTSVEPVAGTVLWARKIAVVRRAGAWDRLSLAARCLRLVLPIFFFFQAEDGIRDIGVTGVQTCALPILAVLMLDGIELKGRCCVVALGIDTDGIKHPLGLWDGSTENATVATTLLANLVERGLDVEQGVLVVLDGAKALRKAVRDVFGTHTPVQRCVRHKERNVLGHLPERDRQIGRAS